MITIHPGDCLAVLRTMPDASVEAIVTDPPYGLSEHKPATIAKAVTAWTSGDREHVPDGKGFMGRCVHPDTDILTRRGWLRAPEVTTEDEVMALNPDTGVAEYVPVVETHRYPFDGELLNIGGRSTRQVVTPNHKVWTDRGLLRADALPKKFGVSNQGYWAASERETIEIGGHDFDAVALGRFVGLWLGDGAVCHRKAQPWKQNFITFTVLKKRKVEAIRQACADLSVFTTETPGADGRVSFYVYDKPLLGWLSTMGGARTKHIPHGLLDVLPEKGLEALYQGLIETDGTRQGPKGQELFFTSSPALADDMQTLCLLTGRSAVKTWRDGRPVTIVGHTYESSGCWVLSIIQAGKRQFWTERDGRTNRPQPAAVTPVAYAGDVHCVTLARHHVMMTRYDGRPVWTGNSWDSFVPPPAVWDECLRVLKPGGHLLCFAGTRTVDLMGLSIRLAGFEMRDTVTWMYGSGFPKSLDVSKAIDKAGGDALAFRHFAVAYAVAVKASSHTHTDIDRHLGIKSSSCYWARTDHRGGMPPRHHWEQVRDLLKLDAELERLYNEAEREVIGTIRNNQPGGTSAFAQGGIGEYQRGDVREREVHGGPTTDAARQWSGWGTALKPASEPIIVARKPLSGTVAATVLEHGTGALNIDATRVAHASATDLAESQSKNPGRDGEVVTSEVYGAGRPQQSVNTEGRWPTNVVFTHAPSCTDSCGPGCPVRELDQQSGVLQSWMSKTDKTIATDEEIFGKRGPKPVGPQNQYGDTGGASRFFPVFKYQAKAPTKERPKIEVDGKDVGWPTVKPLELMRWLVRLVTPPGGVVLDPFAGTGTTGQAAELEGFSCVLIERDELALRLIAERLAGVEFEVVDVPEPAVELAPVVEPAPPTLFDLIAAADESEFTDLWRAHKDEWTDEHTAVVKARLGRTAA